MRILFTLKNNDEKGKKIRKYVGSYDISTRMY